MYRTVKTVLLLLLIAACGLFIYAKSQSLGPDTNYFNTHFRPALDRNPLMRKILSLHNDGDALSDYLGSRYDKISIEVDITEGTEADRSVLDRFAQAVQAITGKQTSYLISDANLPFYNQNDDQIDSIARLYQNVFPSNTATLYVLLMDTKRGQPLLLGQTYHEDGIVIFQQAVKNFAGGNSLIYENYDYSTLLHEFGHQIGLDHNNQEGCLMNPKADSSDRPSDYAFQIVTDFCPLEYGQINQLKASAQ